MKFEFKMLIVYDFSDCISQIAELLQTKKQLEKAFELEEGNVASLQSKKEVLTTEIFQLRRIISKLSEMNYVL
jgi:hypothetical protein